MSSDRFPSWDLSFVINIFLWQDELAKKQRFLLWQKLPEKIKESVSIVLRNASKKKDNIFDVLLDSVPFVQFKKREKHPWHTYVCVSGGKKSFFFGKFGSLCFLVTPILRWVLFPYHWQNVVVLKGFTKLPGLCKGILPRKFFKIISYPFSTIVPLLYLLQTSENRRFFDVFKGYRSGTLFENGLAFSRCNSSLIYWLPIIQQSKCSWC